MSDKVNGTALFTLARLKEDFEQVEEDVLVDLTAVRISAILDLHYNEVELTVEVFGKGGTGDSPVLSERVHPVDVGIDEELLEAGLPIQATVVFGLFDEQTRKLLASRGIGIVWNDDWPSRAEIDPVLPDPGLILAVEDQ